MVIAIQKTFKNIFQAVVFPLKKDIVVLTIDKLIKDGEPLHSTG